MHICISAATSCVVPTQQHTQREIYSIRLLYPQCGFNHVSYAHLMCVVVVYHVTIVAIGHRLLKIFWSMVIGCVLRTAGSSIICNYADPLILPF